MDSKYPNTIFNIHVENRSWYHQNAIVIGTSHVTINLYLNTKKTCMFLHTEKIYLLIIFINPHTPDMWSLIFEALTYITLLAVPSKHLFKIFCGNSEAEDSELLKTFEDIFPRFR